MVKFATWSGISELTDEKHNGNGRLEHSDTSLDLPLGEQHCVYHPIWNL